MNGFKLANYASERGPRAAIVVGDLLYDVADITGRADYASTTTILDQWDEAEEALGQAAAKANGGGMKIDPTNLLAPVLYPHAVYCTGANYQEHMDAVSRHRGMPLQPGPKEMGVGPFFFMKAPRTVVSPIADVVKDTQALDYEVELAVVIGRKARGVSAANALDYVAGYTVANDLSARDRIMRTKLAEGSPFRFDWNGHKNFDGGCPLGPWIVPAAAIGDPQALAMKTWVNGELRQDASTATMIFSVAEQIEALSRFSTLYPGDLILTGTPAGVGAESSTWIDKGDVVRMEIAGIGEITTTIA
ncbi:fumarylacetoacetate hydrolase family protein [Sphingomonas sp. UYEF23]|uniref:fumarylacetoacetate hydrolase family protein n=1 Tax=Sphingomonas sp. UYEF23 TaxID=1756408 RepID=UPI003393452A